MVQVDIIATQWAHYLRFFENLFLPRSETLCQRCFENFCCIDNIPVDKHTNANERLALNRMQVLGIRESCTNIESRITSPGNSRSATALRKTDEADRFTLEIFRTTKEEKTCRGERERERTLPFRDRP